MLPLVKNTLKENPKAGARIIRLIENREPDGMACLRELYPHSGRARVIGMTGPPGVGKSSLIDRIITRLRQENLNIGVVAMDPASPFTGGAVLGDRLRMNRHGADPGVFIRSMSTRGHHGGLSRAAMGAVIVMDVLGNDWIIVETTGVGQTEVDIKKMAHTTAVVMMPGMGDHIQTMKAGLLEIGDIFIINKSDLPNSSQTMEMFAWMRPDPPESDTHWHPPVLGTVAIKDQGIQEVIQALNDHHRFLESNKRLKAIKSERGLWLYRELLREQIPDRVLDDLRTMDEYKDMVKDIRNEMTDPFSAADRTMEKLKISF